MRVQESVDHGDWESQHLNSHNKGPDRHAEASLKDLTPNHGNGSYRHVEAVLKGWICHHSTTPFTLSTQWALDPLTKDSITEKASSVHPPMFSTEGLS